MLLSYLLDSRERPGQVEAHRSVRAVDVSSNDRVEDRPMVADDLLEPAWHHQMKVADAVVVAAALLDEVPQALPADHGEQGAVERLILRVEYAHPVGSRREQRHLVEHERHGAEVVVSRVAGDRPRHLAFERRAQEARLERLIDVDRRDQRARLGMNDHQPLLLEPEQGVPDRGLADAKAFGERRPRQRRARGELQRDDLIAEDVEDLCRHRQAAIEAEEFLGSACANIGRITFIGSRCGH